MSDPNWFADKSKCQREASEMQSRLSSLEMEDTAIKNKDYDVMVRYLQAMEIKFVETIAQDFRNALEIVVDRRLYGRSSKL